MVNSPCLFLQVVGGSFEMRPLESSRFFTSFGFLNLNNFGRCSGKRFASSMYVIVVMRVNSPCRFLLFVDTSFQMTPLESNLAFTFLGILSPTCSGRCSGKRFASSMKVMGFIMVNSPWRFLLFVDTSIVCTPLESSRFFTFLGFLISNALQASARQNTPCRPYQSPSVSRRVGG